ncbi:MAG TPA: hypothetical protein VK837_03390 [Longimicrobiales bacterium]|nr:hypothetical protein [Longimicrobiales bacterium]
MRKRRFLLLPLLLVGCSSLPIVGESDDEKKAECDRIAAQAIQTKDLGEARRLAASASDCYASVQT